MHTENDFIHIRKWLLPLSIIYGLIIWIRNQLFELGILQSKSYDIPIISVGNITVGGTGKTPHVEYLIKLLKDKVNIAVLSRGYKRKSKGYILADEYMTMEKIGDEPYQIKTKFKNIIVAVDKKRTRGIEHIITDETTKETDVILLDDAFQHRYVKAGINILLIDYHRLTVYDKLLPAGLLREPKEEQTRADIIIITKCPKDLKPMEFRVLTKVIAPLPYQRLFFTRLEYDCLKSVFGTHKRGLNSIEENENILLLTGIASPQQITHDLEEYTSHITNLSYPDHHNFTEKDIQNINTKFAAMPTPKIIITTEKDMARLNNSEKLSKEVKENLYVLPIHIRFMLNAEENFNNKVISYVRKNSKNSILVKTKNDNKSNNCHNFGNRFGTISFRNNR